MADVTYVCDEHGIIHGNVTNGDRIITFSISTDLIMKGNDQGLHLLDEMIAAALKELEDSPHELA